MRKIQFIFFLIFSHILVFSQNLFDAPYQRLRDSIQVLPSYDSVSFFRIVNELNQLALQSHQELKKADVLSVLGTYYYFQKNDKKSKLYYDSALNLIDSAKHFKLYNSITLKRSYQLLDKGEFEYAKKYYLSKQSFFQKQKDTLALIIMNMALAQIYQHESKHDKSIQSLYQALKLSVESRDLYYEATCRSNLGGEYLSLGKMTEAQKEFSVALEVALKLNNKKLVANIRSNIASIYLHENKIEEALKVYQENLKFFEKTKFYYEISYMNLNISLCYSKLNDVEHMKIYGNRAISILVKNQLPVEAISVYIQIMNLHYQHQLYKEVIDFGMETQQLSESSHVAILEPNYYVVLSRAYEQLHDYSNALKFQKRYTVLKDSLNQLANEKTVNELVYHHEMTEKEQKLKLIDRENELLRKENELYVLNKKYYLIIAFMVLLLLFLLGIATIQRRLKQQKELYASQLIEDVDRERERIAMDLHDELGLRISMVRQKVMSHSEVKSSDKTDVENDLYQILERTRRISRELFPATVKHISFEEYVKELFKDIELKTGIICSYEFEVKLEFLPFEEKMHLIRILQECLHNTIKYARATAIRFETILNGKFIELSYLDNGVGIYPSDSKSGLGFQNIKQRVRLIHADMEITVPKTGKGFKIIIYLPYDSKNFSIR